MTIWLTIRDAIELEGISRREVMRRLKPRPVPCGAGTGHEPHYISKREGGRRLILLSSLGFPAQQRWQERQIKTAATEPPGSMETMRKTHAGLSPAADLPASAPGQLTLLPRTALDDKIANLRLALAPSHADVAIQRYRIIEPLLNHDAAALGYASGTEYVKATAPTIGPRGVHPNTVWRWLSTYKKTNDLASLANDRPGPAPGTNSALDISMQAHLKDSYLLRGMSKIESYRSLVRYLETKQRALGASYAYSIPCASAAYRFLRSIPAAEATFARQGARAFDDRCGGYISRRPPEFSNDVWVTDQRLVDVRLRDGGERLGRIWMVNFLDVTSWKWLGCWVSPVLSSDTVMRAATVALGRYGVPRAVHEDRGKEFNCIAFNGRYSQIAGETLFREIEGLWERLGVRVVTAIGRNPKSKTIERWHREVARFDAKFPGATGSNTQERPEKLAEEEKQHAAWKRGECASTPLVRIEHYVQKFLAWCESEWNAAHHGQGKYLRGMTPNQAYNTRQPDAAHATRRVSAEELEYLTADRRRLQVSRGGQINVTLYGQKIEYASEVLFPHIGEEVEVLVSRQTLARVAVFNARGEKLCDAALKPLFNWLPEDRDDLRAAIRANAAMRRAVRRGLEAQKALVAGNVVPDPAFPEMGSAEAIYNSAARAFSPRHDRVHAPRTLSSEEVAEKFLAEDSNAS